MAAPNLRQNAPNLRQNAPNLHDHKSEHDHKHNQAFNETETSQVDHKFTQCTYCKRTFAEKRNVTKHLSLNRCKAKRQQNEENANILKLVSKLQEQLSEKDAQIEALSKQISNLSSKKEKQLNETFSNLLRADK